MNCGKLATQTVGTNAERLLGNVQYVETMDIVALVTKQTTMPAAQTPWLML